MQEDVYIANNFDITKGNGTIDACAKFVFVDENLHRFLGIKAERTRLSSLIIGEDADRFNAEFSKFEGSFCFVTKMLRVDSYYRDVLLIITDKGDKDELELEVMDILNAKLRILRLEQESLKYRNLMQIQNIMFFDFKPQDGRFRVYYIENTREVILVAMSIEEMRSNKYTDRLSDEEKSKNLQFCDSIENGDMFFEYRFKGDFKNRVLGDAKVLSLVGHTVYNSLEDFFTLGIIKTVDNENPDFLFNSSSLDIITGLFNKKAILDIGRRYLEEKTYKQLFFVMIDIDNFKLVNDNYGHAMGDKVIVDVANILKTVVGDRGAVGRFGGDEYFVVMYELGSEGDLRSVLEAIVKEVGELYKTVFEGFNISCSMGISEYPKNGDDFDILFKKADKGLYLAKKKGKKRYIIYKEEMHGELNENEIFEENYFKKKNSEKIAGDITIYNMINEGIQDLFLNGNDAVDRVMNRIIDMYNLSGISIYLGEDMGLLKNWGEYSKPMLDASYMKEDVAIARFNKKNIFLENNVRANGFYVPEIHDKLLRHNICSTLQCMVGTPENVKGVVTFDVEEVIRSWSECDAHYFGIISQILGIIYS